ncbi:MAG: YkgJ family cysteine cluster protein [Cyanobacteriota bacterium]
MKQELKKKLFNLLGIKHWRSGKCNKCGHCCRTITFRFPDKLLTRESEFEYLKKQMPRFENFYISGKADNGVLLFTCKFLTDDNKCGVYYMRSPFCRYYPHFDSKFIRMGGQPLEGCGFYYEPVVPFDEVFEKQKNKLVKCIF